MTCMFPREGVHVCDGIHVRVPVCRPGADFGQLPPSYI